jgi:hypothetical protein
MIKLNFPKFFALLLLGFINNSYAIDTYNFTTKTLKIPQVMVGDTTFNDVEIKLNDFEVLAVGDDPLVGILDEGLVLQFTSATRQAGQLHITMELTSKDKDRSYRVGKSHKARVTDNIGLIYDVESVSIPRISESETSIFHLFDADTPVTVIYTFDDLDPQATSISLLDILFGSNSPAYKLRDLPIEEFDVTQ